ncbi:hypothetical protein BGZ65_013009 [Modicella reniformis]|uniref:Cut9 interacting protein Scn1 n=1 Tax=Modicella reniformis TaxID=1440133 RepID=A0A9P6J512_9FUNG|nr:hypothetical protein BGZ65_013009 [Modicella reniformis]
MCGSGGHDNQQEPSTPVGDQDPGVATHPFPQHLYTKLTDAHCHIQDDRENIHKLVQSWSSGNSTNGSDITVAPLLTGKSCLMGVQPSKDLGLTSESRDPENNIGSIVVGTESLYLATSSSRSSSTPIVTVTWNDTDTKGDWDLVSRLAKDHPDRFVPCFGIHPWFTHKYKPLEGSAGSTFELRGVTGAGNRAGAGDTASPSNEVGSSPSLSFSSSHLTEIPGPGVRREAFLAMSRQLQEQMAKENHEKPAIQEEGAASIETPQNFSNTAAQLDPVSNAKPTESLASHQDHARYTHYQKVLSLPSSAPRNYLEELAKRLPEPRALEPALKELRRQLEAHPHAVLGEVGLDRTARVLEPSVAATMDNSSNNTNNDNNQKKTTLALTSIQHQLDIVREQLKFAASLNRAVSFHCVQAYGHWHDFLIQEGRQLKEIEDNRTYQQQLEQIHASGGAVTIPAVSPSGIRLSRKTAAKLKREARDAAWERHVASTLQESSDEEEEEEEEEGEGKEKDERSSEVIMKQAASVAGDNDVLSIPASASSLPMMLAPYEPILPPRLCMHSYGGSRDMLKAFTKLDHPPEIFFSFSIVINGRLQEQKLKELIMAVPEDRLLIESDHHSHSQVDSLLVEMVQRVAQIRGWTVEETVEKTAQNWHRFVYG